MFKQSSSNSLTEIETICRTLSNVIGKSFGPRGHCTLLSTNTGHVSLTSDGYSILSSLHLSHPIARSIIRGLTSFHSHHGDGCKSIVLYLSALSNALQVEAGNCSHGSMQDSETFTRGYLSRYLIAFLNHDMPFIVSEMTKDFATKLNRRKGFLINDVIFKITKAVLGVSSANDNAAHLASVVCEYLTHSCATSNDIRELCLWFDNSVFLIPHQLFFNSFVKSGLCLTSNLHYAENLLGDIFFICMQCPIEGTLTHHNDNSSDIIHLTSSDNFINSTYSVVTQFLSSVKEKGIRLIISSNKVSDIGLQLCQASDLAVIDCVDDDDLLWICALCRKSPVTSVKVDIEGQNVMQASSCERIRVGAKSFTNINLIRDFCHPKTLFVAGPSDGVCQQLKIQVKKCITVISRFIDNISDRSEKLEPVPNGLLFNVIPGGGFFEAAFINQLYKYQKEMTNPGIKMCCSVIQKMLFSVPKMLCAEQGLPFSKCVPDVNLFADSVFWMDIIETGTDCNILEVFSVKVASVYSAISLMVSLLRIDKIIGAQHRQPSTDESEEEFG